MPPPPNPTLVQHLKAARRIFIFAGAGISTGSGIPDFRGPQGIWKTRQPVYYDDFMSSEAARIEYWDFKLETWQRYHSARPNPAHFAIARLESAGRVEAVVTQNIDGLHELAGTSREKLVEIHGTDRWVACQTCGEMTEPGPHFEAFRQTRNPPRCHCGGFLKPATISFGQRLREDDLERAARAAQHADLVLALGVRFDDRVTGKIEHFCPHAKIIHVDVDPSSISKNVKVHIPILGPVSSVLNDMRRLLKEHGRDPNREALAQWWKQIDEWRAMECLSYDRNCDKIKPQFAVETLYKVTKGDLYLTSDVGQHQMFAAQFYPFDRPRRWINSGGLGTMGFGLPAAMGVQLAYPDAQVACISGEASILMCIQEMATCKQYGLPVKVVLLNNGYMGMVRQWQEFFYGSRYSHSYVDALPDFVKLAESFGHLGMRIEKPGELEAAMSEAFGMKDRFVFLDVVVDPTENVYPMIEAGKGHHQMHLSPVRELA